MTIVRRLDDKPSEVSEVVVAEGNDLARDRAFDGAVGAFVVVVVTVVVVTALIMAAVMAAVLPFPRMLPVAVPGGDDYRWVATHASDTTGVHIYVAPEHRPPLRLQRHRLLDVPQDRQGALLVEEHRGLGADRDLKPERTDGPAVEEPLARRGLDGLQQDFRLDRADYLDGVSLAAADGLPNLHRAACTESGSRKLTYPY